MSFFSKFSGYLTGFAPDSVETPTTARINGAQVKMAPGLRLCDEEGLKTARRAGWIMSMNMLRANNIHENDAYYWDILPESTLQSHLATMANALLKLEAQRQGSVVVALGAKERLAMVNELYESLLVNTGLTKADLTNGYITLRLGLEQNRCSTPQRVAEVMKGYEIKGTYPPVVVFKTAMAAMCRDFDLLALEKQDQNSTITFRPVHESTKLDDNASGMNITDQISDIEFANETVLSGLTDYMDKTVYELEDVGEIEDISSNMQATVAKLRSVTLQVNKEKGEIEEAKQKLHHTFSEQAGQIEELNQIIHTQTLSVKTKEEEIERLQSDLMTVKEELREKTESLEADLAAVTQEKKQHALHTVPAEQVDEAERQIAELEGEVKDRRQNEQKLRRKIKEMKTEYAAKIAEKESAIQTADGIKQSYRSTMDETKVKMEQLRNENSKLQSDLASKQKENGLLVKRVDELNRSVKQTSIRRQTAVNVKERMNNSLSLSADKTLPLTADEDDETEITSSDVKEMFQFKSTPRTVLCASMTNKEANNYIPNWEKDDGVMSFCQKIELAWNVCNKQSFDQEQFCIMLRLHLPQKAGDVVNAMTPDDQKKVVKIVEKLRKHLGGQELEYLREFSSVTKDASETHQEYALRVKRLYMLGTGSSNDFNATEKKIIVEHFLRGLPPHEQSSVRLVATDTEMADIDQLALRAGRSGKTQHVNALPNLATKTPQGHKPEHKQRRKITFECHYCHKIGHSWRKCRSRAQKEPEWKPAFNGKKQENKKQQA